MSSTCVYSNCLTRPRSLLAQAMSIDQVAEQGATGDPVHDPDRESCVVCLDEDKSHILIPSGHQCVCGTCGERLAQAPCPVCRRAVTMAVRVYT